jgi:hypothetical protein
MMGSGTRATPRQAHHWIYLSAGGPVFYAQTSEWSQHRLLKKQIPDFNR